MAPRQPQVLPQVLQNANEFALLRLEDVNVIQVIRELEGRTGLTIRRSNPD